MNEPKTTTELITSLCEKFDEKEWEPHVWPLAVSWNKNHYKVEESLLREMYESLTSMFRLTKTDVSKVAFKRFEEGNGKLKCVGCDAKFHSFQGIGDDAKSQQINDLVCPGCKENLESYV